VRTRSGREGSVAGLCSAERRGLGQSPILIRQEPINLNFILDLHCHTVISGHAYSTISENAAHAASIGLTHMGIADHGPKMLGGANLYHFLNLRALPDTIHGVKILQGAEANILNINGELDLPDYALERLDFVIASMHREIILTSDCASNTKAMVNAMESPHMHILGHPNSITYAIDIEAMVKAAAKTKTIIEINEGSLIPGLFRYPGDEPFIETLALCKEYNVSVLASSDSHFATHVGEFTRAKSFIESSGIPEELVVNTSPQRLLDAIKAKKELMS